LEYSVTSTCDIPKGLWLGASIWDEHGKWANSNVIEDQAVAIRKGSHAYHRTLTPGTDWKTRGLRVEGGSMVRHPRARERSVLDAEREACRCCRHSLLSRRRKLPRPTNMDRRI
jgi:hypothetical protein